MPHFSLQKSCVPYNKKKYPLGRSVYTHHVFTHQVRVVSRILGSDWTSAKTSTLRRFSGSLLHEPTNPSDTALLYRRQTYTKNSFQNTQPSHARTPRVNAHQISLHAPTSPREKKLVAKRSTTWVENACRCVCNSQTVLGGYADSPSPRYTLYSLPNLIPMPSLVPGNLLPDQR